MPSKIIFVAGMLACLHSAHAETIGISKAVQPDTFQTALWKGVEGAGAKSGLSLTSSIAKGDSNLQVAQMEAFYAAGVDGIIASLASLKMSAVIVAKAREAHKPLVFVNTAPNAELLGAGVSFVGSNEAEAGMLQMTEVCRQMNGKGTVVILMGELSHPAAQGRTTAVHDILKSPACGSIELLEEQSAGWSRPQASEVVRSWLGAGLRPDAVVANNDDMALGAIDALKEAGIKGTIVAGIDATDAGLSAMQAGDLKATVLQDARQQGEKAVAVVRAMIAGEAVPRVTMIPFKLITPDRAAQVMQGRAGG